MKTIDLISKIDELITTINHQQSQIKELLVLVEQAGGNEELAKFNIALAQATLESLYKLKEMGYGE